MNLLSWLRDRWSREGVPYSYVPIDPTRVELGDGRALDTTPITEGMRYYRLWLAEMALEHDRQWFSDWQPAVYAATRFLFDGREQLLNVIAGPSALTELSGAAAAKSVALNYPLTPLLPYNGGDVEFEVGLASIQGSNDVSALLDVVTGFSKLLNVPQFSQALSLVEPLASGITALLGGDRARPVLRVHNTLTSGAGAGANQLRGGYFVVLSTPAGDVRADELWVIRDRLYRGASRQAARPFGGAHHMLFRLESTAERSDWSALSTIAEPYELAMDALAKSVYGFSPDEKALFALQAERYLGAAQASALRAKELTRVVGRNQAVTSMREAFDQTKRTLGQGAVATNVPATLADAVAAGPSAAEAAAMGDLFDPQTPAAATRSGHQGAAPAAPPATQLVARTPHMDVVGQEPFAPGHPFTVSVYTDRLAARAGETTTNLAIEVPVTLAALDLEVWIAGTSHFEFVGSRIGGVRIGLKAGEADTSASFSVKVVAAPPDTPAQLHAYFQYEGRPCGSVSRTVALTGGTSAEADPPVAPPVVRAQVDAVRPDLTIVIADPLRDRQHLQCLVTSPHVPGPATPEPWPLPHDTGDLVRGLMQEFVKPGASNTARLLSLRGAGAALWDAVPDSVKRAFWALVDSGKPFTTILIVSEEPYFPWELAIPSRVKDGAHEPRGALGAEFAIGRWLPDDHITAPQRVPISTGLVVAPDYAGPTPKPLAHALDEAEYVLGKVGGTSVTPVDLDHVHAALTGGTYDLLHFVCHGADAGGGPQKIFLEGGELSSQQLTGMFPARRGLGDKPLVFLNACEIGRTAPALVGVGGFAKAFIDAGASAVIAPLWSIKDKYAPAVCRSFYDAVMADETRPFADVMRGIRAQAYGSAAGEDTYAAYCFYGDPCAARVPKKVLR